MTLLLIHFFREMRPVLVQVFILFSIGLLFDLTSGTPISFYVFFCAPAVLTSPLLLYSSGHVVDFTLPLSRRLLYRSKMTAVFLAVGIGFGVPLLGIPGFRAGGVTADMARTTLLLLAYLFASVSVSVAIWPALKKSVNEDASNAAADVVMLVGAAIVVLVHGAVGFLIYSTGSQGYLAAVVLMVVCVLAYWKGRAVFMRYEPVAHAVCAAADVGESMATRRGPSARGWSITSVGKPSGVGKAAGLLFKAGEGASRAVLTDDSLERKYARRITSSGPGTLGTQVAGRSSFRKTPLRRATSVVRQSGTGSSRGLSALLDMSTTWRFPWMIRPRNTLLRGFVILALFAIQLLIVMSLARHNPKALAPLPIIFLLLISAANAGVDWGMLVSLVPAAYPRRRLFTVITLIRLSPVLVGSLLTALFLDRAAAVLVGTVFLALHSLFFWLTVAPSPRQVFASWTHYLLNWALLVGCFLSIGVWVLADMVNYSLAMRMPAQWSSYFTFATPLQPSVAWRVSGVCTLAAIFLWAHAYKRFKYMEGVPHSCKKAL